MGEPTAQVSQDIQATPQAIWKALTTPEILKSYFMGADVESDWRVGSPIRFRGEVKGKKYEDKGEIRTFEPQKRLAFSHYSPVSGAPDTPESYHVVTFELEPGQGASTHVTLTQSNLTGGVREADVKHRQEFEKNWTSVLQGLKGVVEKH